MSWFASAFDSLPDPRTGNAQPHDLLEALTRDRAACAAYARGLGWETSARQFAGALVSITAEAA